MDWRALETFAPGDNPSLADELVELVIAGKKTATCWAAEQGSLTEIGKRMVMLDGTGRPRVVIETIELTQRRFPEVDAADAANPAAADPAADTQETISQAHCVESYKSTDECLNELQARMAGNQGYQEAALLACPGLRVTDPALRDFRTKKYGNRPEFKKSYDYVIEGIGRPDFDEERTCRIASEPEAYPTAYQGEWLTLKWTAADRLPLMTTETLGRAGGRFRAGYADGRLAGEEDQAAYRAYRAYGTREGDTYERGWEAGRTDAMRARRK